MSNFEFPTNIRQIGNLNDGLRIYVEDYVCSFLQQYAQISEHDERLAILVGRRLTIDSNPVLFISGAIQGRFAEEKDGILNLSERSFEYINEQMEIYFGTLEIVGLMQSQPGYGSYLNPRYGKYFIESFKEPSQVLFVTDPMDKLNSFYILDEASKTLKETKGYFVYYEKNKNMHNYMLDNKANLSQFAETKEEKLSKAKIIENNEELYFDFDQEDKEEKQEKQQERGFILQERRPRRPTGERDIIKRQAVRRRKTQAEYKRTINMLTSLSVIMVILCFIMGAGLLRSEERITQLENNLIALQATHNNTLNQLTEAEPVFAEIPVQSDDEDTATVVEVDGNSLIDEDDEAENDFSELLELIATFQTDGVSDDDEETVFLNDIPETYIVQRGDSLLGISQRFFNTTDMVGEIMRLNNIENPDRIYFGKVLVLPRG